MTYRPLTAVTCAAALLAATAAAASGPGKGGTLTIGVAREIHSTQVADKHDDATQTVLHHIMEGLVAYREDMSIGPMLAESYAVSDDGRTYTFTLRQGIKFHNGASLTSADVKWTWELYSNPERTWGEHCREFYDGSAKVSTVPSQIASISAPDRYTVVFELESPSSTFLPYMASNYCVAGILHRDSLDHDGSWKTAISTGPYKVGEWRKGEYLELARFAEYVPRSEPRSGNTGAKIAYFDTLRFVPMPDSQSSRQALLEGKVDFLIDVPFSDYPRYKADRRIATQIAQRPAMQMIIVQGLDPLLADIRMRQAVAHAIDHERVVRETIGSEFKPNPSIIPLGFRTHTAVHDETLGYDPAKAKALLKEAGYEGAVLRIMTRRQYDNPFMWMTASSVLGMLREAGINAVIEEKDFNGHDASLYENNYQLNASGWSTRTDATQWYAVVVGKKNDRKSSMWQDMQAISWAYQAAVTTDDAQRQAIYDRLHRKMLETVPLIPLFNAPVITASDRDLRGYQPWTFGLSRFWGVWRE